MAANHGLSMPANSVLIDPAKTHLIRAIAIYGANAGSATLDRGILLAPLVCRHDHILGMKNYIQCMACQRSPANFGS